MSDEDKATNEPPIVYQPLSRPGTGRKLTQAEKIAIVTDLMNNVTWKEIQNRYKVASSTISYIKNQFIAQDSAALEVIKKARLGKLYQSSDKYLDVLASKDPEALDKEPLKDIAVVYGIQQTKINELEGLVGNINVAVATFQQWGFGAKPVEDKK